MLQARYGGLEEEARGLQGRLGEVEGDNRGLAAEVRHLKAALEEGQAALLQQRQLSHDLQSTVDGQRTDIRAALDLVSQRPFSQTARGPNPHACIQNAQGPM